jgi:hypothetical protein
MFSDGQRVRNRLAGRYQNIGSGHSGPLRPAQRHELGLAMWLAVCIGRKVPFLADLPASTGR